MKDSRKVTITWDDKGHHIEYHDGLENDLVDPKTSSYHLGMVIVLSALADLPREEAAALWASGKREIEDTVFSKVEGDAE